MAKTSPQQNPELFPTSQGWAKFFSGCFTEQIALVYLKGKMHAVTFLGLLPTTGGHERKRVLMMFKANPH